MPGTSDSRASVVPTPFVVTCAQCHLELGDDRGGRLLHHADGSHTFVPPGWRFAYYPVWTTE